MEFGSAATKHIHAGARFRKGIAGGRRVTDSRSFAGAIFIDRGGGFFLSQSAAKCLPRAAFGGKPPNATHLTKTKGNNSPPQVRGASPPSVAVSPFGGQIGVAAMGLLAISSLIAAGCRVRHESVLPSSFRSRGASVGNPVKDQTAGRIECRVLRRSGPARRSPPNARSRPCGVANVPRA